MGAEAWDYFVPYEEDIQQALEKLRLREFRAGRFRGAENHPASIEEAFCAAFEIFFNGADSRMRWHKLMI